LSLDATLKIRFAAGAIASVAAIAIVIWFGLREREPPLTCADGFVRSGARCCGLGQTLVEGRCAGVVTGCGNGFERHGAGVASGCVVEARRVSLGGGRLPPGAADWQAVALERELEVAAFAIDSSEVTVARYTTCVRAKACAALTGAPEPGLPVSGVAPERAERFCRFAGGRLPSSAEWRFAAGGTDGRRFPWGFTGLVCRRAAFGLLTGPCSNEGRGPDLAGARPDGRTPAGVLDLAGNVAEWSRDPGGSYRARGGSFRSRVAAELMTAAVESPATNAPHVGFRCVYELADTEARWSQSLTPEPPLP
jgi:formylglycine-generating enzyme required for sulfatase activity